MPLQPRIPVALPSSEMAETTLGQDRVLKGWWKPERYSELRYAGRESLKGWLS